ncbi:RagB/SusD family nutrient uptake outer membrane protein [Niabella beijingensis]|uniref:RagB/SusD family nutrient uptake outer membrane protein n=1 Tax=Niabella beijingensis TaxID=2872700 RepID=UPI001CBB9988|nr:RagB/SusD family nutrient uptake outer membrane protein [Niabella beijingensis]MBZ4190088.1 RagB/SusD family nutrient uptake outer membrane protein [Niabella beijingensis]
MKSNIYIPIIIACISLSSCVKLKRDAMDAYPVDKYFTSEQAALQNLAAIYQNTKMSGFFEDGNAILMDDITDNGYNPFSNQWPSYIALGSGTAAKIDGRYVDLYRTYFPYTGIRSANYFLENVDKVPMDEEKKNIMKAEARFLRAFDYARKLMCFGGVPLVTKVLAYGDETKIGRSTEEEIAAFVKNELAEVADILPLKREDEELGRATKGAALALKARLELFTRDYVNAAKDAKSIIDLNQYELFNDYEGLFWEKNQKNEDRNNEVILEVKYTPPTWGSWIDALYTVAEGGWNSVNPTQSMVDAYETKNGSTVNPDKPYDNRDPRFYATIIFPGQTWNGRIFNSLEPVGPDEYYNSSQGNRSRTGYCLRKYCAPVENLTKQSPEEAQGLNFIVFRYAEVLLTYAEALIEQGSNLGEAASAINKVRARAGMPPVTNMSQEGLRQKVRNERRVELAFEGLRWYDIKRWKIGGQVMNGPVHGVRPGKVNMTTGAVTFSSANHITVGDVRVFNEGRDYYFPIPQEDIDASEALKGHQNPGW